MKILFKYTTRSRRDNFLRGYNSIIQNLSDQNNYHILISIDNDDKSMENLKLEGIHTIISGNSKSKVDAINRDINNFSYNWDIVINMSDDMVFIKKNFDNIIRSKFTETLDRCLLFNDGNRADIITMSILGREYYKRDNYIYNPAYKSFFCDNEATEVAGARGCLIRCQEKIFLHLHWAYGKAEKDNLYAQAMHLFNEDKICFRRRKKNGFVN